MGRASVFENRKLVPLFAGSAALSWACAFPLIKLGLADFGIAGTDTGGKALFAGARFLLAGLVVLAVAKLCGRSFAVPRARHGGSWCSLVWSTRRCTTFSFIWAYPIPPAAGRLSWTAWVLFC